MFFPIKDIFTKTHHLHMKFIPLCYNKQCKVHGAHTESAGNADFRWNFTKAVS